jgi:benzylsuccinate CoA-transferase BbsF subunit
MGEPPWSRNDHLTTGVGRLDRQDEIEMQIALWSRDQDAAEVVERLQTAGIPAGVVQKAVDLFDDPQLAHRGHFRTLDHVEMGRVAYNGPAHDLSETPAVLRWAAPLLGEHTKYVLKELLGYSDPQIQDMAARQILE